MLKKLSRPAALAITHFVAHETWYLGAIKYEVQKGFRLLARHRRHGGIQQQGEALVQIGSSDRLK